MKKKILLSAVLSSVLFLGACSQVDNGERGLYVKWGETQNEVLKEGVYFYNPFSTSLITIDTKEKLWEELAEKAKNDTIRIQEEANQKLIQAKAEAEAMGIKSEALSKNKSLVEYEAVQKWNGELPQYVGTGMPFLNLSPKN